MCSIGLSTRVFLLLVAVISLLAFVVIISPYTKKDSIRGDANSIELRDASFSFISLGDWGVPQDGDSVATAMNIAANSLNASFVLGLGDNFYEIGVNSLNDPKFESIFRHQFNGDKLSAIPWYMCAGNHDYYGNISAQIDYSSLDSRWKFPSLYFSETFQISDYEVLLISIDTWRLNGGDTGPKQHILKDEVQLQWIENTLKEATAQIRLVIGHYPVFSAAVMEHGDTPVLIDYLKPLFEKYNVDAYFSGHDHILQHNSNEKVQYFGSGAGGKASTRLDPTSPHLMGYSVGRRGFMTHTVNSSSMITNFIVESKSVYQVTTPLPRVMFF